MPFFNPPSTDVNLNYLILDPESNSSSVAGNVSAAAVTILLIHGWTCSLDNFSFQMPFLNSLGYRLIAVDLRGHGHSWLSKNTTDYSPQVCASDLIALLAHLGYDGSTEQKQVVLMGHSAGGVISSLIAVSRPDLVRGAVLIDPAYILSEQAALMVFSMITGSPPEEAYAAVEAELAAATPTTVSTDTEGVGTVGRTSVAAFFDNEGIMPASTPAWLKSWILNAALSTHRIVMMAMLFQGWGQGRIGAAENFPAWAREHKWTEKLKKRLVVYANADQVEKEKDFGLGPFDEVAQVDDAGHWLMMKEWEKTNHIIGQWLDKAGLKP